MIVQLFRYLLQAVLALVITGPVLAAAVALSLTLALVAIIREALDCLAAQADTEHLALDTLPDPADRRYLSGPALRDHRRLGVACLVALHQRGLAQFDESFAGNGLRRVRPIRESELITRSPAVPILTFSARAGFAIGYILALVLLAITWLVQLVLLTVAVTGFRLLSGTLWLFEVFSLALRQITTECPRCHTRLTRPVFVCPCGREHHALVPGAQGVFLRTCRCGQSLPTLLITGKRGLSPQCGDCGASLPSPTQMMPTRHVPVVGGTGAGKSVFLHTAVTHMRSGHDAAPADPFTDHRLAETGALLADGLFPPRTPVSRPVSYTLQVRNRLLHLYDAAGEIVQNADHIADSVFLALSDGVVLVVDPLALPAVRARADPDVLGASRTSGTDPKAVLDLLTETLTEHHTATPRRIAVVVTKGDTLSGPTHPYATRPPDRPAAVRAWLIAHGHVDIVHSAEHHFPHVHYFVVTYLTTSPTPHDDPAAPIHWLLTGTTP
ncbi:TRAFAC clade GTPase domain-containing protein [Actinosynnema sp. CS-041913]|uniref:TRAFAC clade GTPase domain-containing protein n=1 Tax=Actinosynnema sp. CS-041913 TaxID=3239917 RepID=UPI003D8B92D5